MLDHFELPTGGTVALSENEKIILERMRNPQDGTEYDMIFKGPAVPVDQQRFAPRDQVDPLVSKGLATYCVGIDSHGEFGIQLNNAGRYVLDQYAPVAKPLDSQARQYGELTEDELIDLLAETAETYASHLVGVPADMAAIAVALKKRRDGSKINRARIAEYLRHQQLKQDKYDKDMASDSDYSKRNARKPEDVIDSIRVDEWTSGANLLLTDLQRLVTPVVRDTKAEFFEQQALWLEQWKSRKAYQKLPDKQKALLECVAKGHISSSYRGWKGDQDEVCRNIHGATANSLIGKKIFTGTRPRPGGGIHHSSFLTIKRPGQSSTHE